MNPARLAALALFVLVSAAQAQVVEYTGTFQVSQDNLPLDLRAGDNFLFGFTLDHSRPDTNSSTINATFIGSPATDTFWLLRDPGNQGTWDPTGITFSTSRLLAEDRAPSSPERVSILFVSESGTLDGLELELITFVNYGAVLDMGLNAPMTSVLGGMLNPAVFEVQDATLFFIGNNVTGTITSFAAVPEANSGVLIAATATCLVLLRRWRRTG